MKGKLKRNKEFLEAIWVVVWTIHGPEAHTFPHYPKEFPKELLQIQAWTKFDYWKKSVGKPLANYKASCIRKLRGKREIPCHWSPNGLSQDSQ